MMGKITDIERWRAEIELSAEMRKNKFGELTEREVLLTGENVQYYENGVGESLMLTTAEEFFTTLNIVDAIVSIIVPSLSLKNLRTVVLPKKSESEQSAPIVARTIDHFRDRVEAEETNQMVIWDAYVLGYGCYKIGYTTKFGSDIKDESEKKKDKVGDAVKDAIKKMFGKKEEEKPIERKDIDIRVIEESPFIKYISPFKFYIDPRAESLNTAMWWGHGFSKTVDEIKNNKKYKNTEDVVGDEVDMIIDMDKIGTSDIEAFKMVEVFEIHYRSDGKFYILVLSKDKNGEWREHYHDETIYRLGEWQCDMLTFKKHGHALYPRSDISKIKMLQDRITTTIDSILEQVDKFVPKLAFDVNGVTDNGKKALKAGGIGALVECNQDPSEVFKELNFTQLKADLQALIDQLITLISIQTGITRASLTGMSASETATEATIQQGGQNIRLSDMTSKVHTFVNRQSRKLWKIIRQFVDLEELQLINGVKGVDPVTGSTRYNWLMVDGAMATQMQEGDYDFNIEVGSTERLNLAVVRKAFENWFNILARTEVVALMQQQGKKFDIAEFAKKGLDAFPELGIDSSKIISDIAQDSTGLLQPEQIAGALGVQQGGTTQGSNVNELRSMMGEKAPSMPTEIGRSQ